VRTVNLSLVIVLAMSVACLAAEIQTPIVTDADAFGDVRPTDMANWNANFGSAINLKVGSGQWYRKSYMQFDLSAPLAHPALPITSASLQVAWETTEFGPGLTKIFAIMDETKDWNLATLAENALTMANAPQADAAGTRFFLEEGTDAAAVVRLLGSNPTPRNGTDPPDPAPINIDVTDFVKWVLGSNAGFSNFVDTDKKVTICMREDVHWDYARYYSKEYTPTDDSDAPRLVITQTVHPGDATYDNRVNVDDLGILASNYDGVGKNWETADFTNDGVVNVDDLGILASNYDWDGTAGGAIPEPASLAMLGLGGLALIRRRR